MGIGGHREGSYLGFLVLVASGKTDSCGSQFTAVGCVLRGVSGCTVGSLCLCMYVWRLEALIF